MKTTKTTATKTTKRTKKTAPVTAPVTTAPVNEIIEMFDGTLYNTVTGETIFALPNNEKTNTEPVKVFETITEITKLFSDCNLLPKFVYGNTYCGCGIKRNEFSVNTNRREHQYNIYCSDYALKLVKPLKLNHTEFFDGANTSDALRKNTIICKCTGDLKTMLLVLANENRDWCIVK